MDVQVSRLGEPLIHTWSNATGTSSGSACEPLTQHSSVTSNSFTTPESMRNNNLISRGDALLASDKSVLDDFQRGRSNRTFRTEDKSADVSRVDCQRTIYMRTSPMAVTVSCSTAPASVPVSAVTGSVGTHSATLLSLRD